MRKLTEDEKKALETVKELISDYRTGIEAITLAKDDIEFDPILVEGETSAGYYCQLMVDPKKVARIALKYEYPIFKVLGEESPENMWRELAAEFGLQNVESFDL